ncbi:penicillin-binding protein [Candidatus Saccharibacteria bacterium]|nr:penicillin-binding protein [Candidatus Saccharibacteria bacterium]
MVKKKKTARRVSVYSNLATKRRTKKDAKSRKKAEYLASLPKHPLKRIAYRLHPKRVAKFWFSKQGLMLLLKGTGVTLLVMLLLGFALFSYYRKDLDAIRPGTLAQRVKTTVSTYYDRNGKVLWEDKGDGDYTLVVDGDKISPYMKQATVAIEDKEFYQHAGVSPSGIVRAVVSNTQGNAAQGGSTLTQQLVKQVFFADQASERGLAGIPRKIKEMILAIEVERMYDKKQIIDLYLNESPYGGRRNGVESAAQTYFGKSAKDLTLAESSLLAAIPNQPGLYDPYNINGHGALIARQHKTLDNMVEMGYIKKEEAEEAKKVEILDTIKPLADQLADIKAPHFVLMVRSQLEKSLGKTVVGNGGLVVKTTLDLDVQAKLEEQMNAMFSSYWPDYAGFTNGAAVVEDVKTGQIIGLLGSRDYRYEGFGQDNAAIAFIQPGSSIKPLVYAQLFQDKGEGAVNYGSGSILPDSPTTFEGNYKPSNADGRFKGNINIRKSLDMSRNIPAIKAMAVAGKDETWETIRGLGNTYYCTQGPDAQAGLSSAIGGCGTRMVDHTNALASLGRMGVYMPHSSILEVKSSNGEILKKYKSETKQIIDPQAAYIVNDILGDVGSRNLLFGSTIVPITEGAGFKVAVKTGTSDKDRQPKDIWTVAYTPQIAMSVWLGNPDTSPLKNGNSAIPARVLDPVLEFALQKYKNEGVDMSWFAVPAGIQRINGEIFPSYYNKSAGIVNTKLTFDKVSKKKATSCTPEAAKIEIGVTKTVDPITKKDVFSAPVGYDTFADDDVHLCGDAQPNVTVVVDDEEQEVTVTYSNGRYQLSSLEVRDSSGSVIASKLVSASGSIVLSLEDAAAGAISATITDTVYYQNSASDSYTPS